MNKMLQSTRLNNHIKMMPIGFEVPDADEIWAEHLWHHLLYDTLTRHAYRCRRASYTLSVWDDGEYAYLVQVIRTMMRSNITTVWIAKYSESQVNDFKAIVKFVHNNYDTKLKKPFDIMEAMHRDTRAPANEQD